MRAFIADPGITEMSAEAWSAWMRTWRPGVVQG